MGWQTALDHNYTLFEKLAAEEGVDVETFTHEIYDTYHAKFPVVKDTMEWCQQLALVRQGADGAQHFDVVVNCAKLNLTTGSSLTLTAALRQ